MRPAIVGATYESPEPARASDRTYRLRTISASATVVGSLDMALEYWYAARLWRFDQSECGVVTVEFNLMSSELATSRASFAAVVAIHSSRAPTNTRWEIPAVD